uniref:Far-red impaired response protein-like n=1 Tax=Oryza sativa subsp. japonica TaxID=39947 RepID=Q84ZS6_ORYSJ|nr:far-red impaired response protein-like [Oryza sativa Japonica Group]
MAHLIHQVERDFPPSSSSANGGTTPIHNAMNLIDVQAPSSSGGFLDVLLSESTGHETDLVVDVESVDNTDVAAVTVEIDEQLDEDASENDEEEKDVVYSPPIVPYIGMEFDTVEEARNVYNAYAYKLGFGTRIASSRNSQASSGGKSIEEIALEEGDITDLTGISQMKTMNFLKTLHDRNIATSQILALLGDLHGGVRNLTFTAKDVSNLRTKLRQQVSLKDVAMTIDYFQKKKTQADNPSFFYAARYDEDNVLKALFWVDGRTRKLYQSYKDCVFFDTTLMTNRYNMPFAPIVGTNNHLQTILLGCALICDETTETFIWVYKTWMRAMNGQKPGSVMTDRDKAMRAAIKKVFPGTIHRCCLWHVTTEADQQLLPVYTSKKGFHEALYRYIYDSKTIA